MSIEIQQPVGHSATSTVIDKKKRVRGAKIAENEALSPDETIPTAETVNVARFRSHQRIKGDIPGQKLLDELEKLAREECVPLEDILARVPISNSYYGLMRSGNRQVAGMEPAKLRSISEMLGVPLSRVYIDAGIMTPEDFVTPYDMQQMIRSSFIGLSNDPNFGGYISSKEDFYALPVKAQQLIAVLYRELNNELANKAETTLRKVTFPR